MDFIEPSDTIFVKQLGVGDPAGRLLAQGPVFRNIDPAWSPSGERLVFTRSPSLFPRAGVGNELWSLGTSGGEPERPGAGGSPDWSATGVIAFTVHTRRSGEMIRTMKSNGANVRTLARGSNPSWSPDGRLIAFARVHPRYHAGIYVMRADATALRRLTHHPGDDEAVWSPDGKKIAFVRRRTYTSQLIVMAADGSATRVVARRQDPRVLATPDWSLASQDGDPPGPTALP